MEPKHKIFLSYSGAQRDFVEQLCVDLEKFDRYPFYDRVVAKEGNLPDLIFQASRECLVGVVVLSEEYFTSKWPMLELNALVTAQKENTNMKILPVFLRISRSQCCDKSYIQQWVSMWDGWAKNDKRVNVEEWKQCLKVLRVICGVSSVYGTSEVQCRRRIVEDICELVPPNTIIDDSYIEGKSRLCQVIREKINMVQESASYGVRVVGIYGMGGSGKTTLCKVLCNEYYKEFHGRVCHAELGKDNEVALLQDMLERLTDTKHELARDSNIDECRDCLKRSIHKRRVFLALDNVSDLFTIMDQAKSYLTVGYRQGSIIIVTARSLDILRALEISKSDCLEMPELEEAEARYLFMHHVNLHTYGCNEEIIIQLIEQCRFNKGNGSGRQYHPLALKVLGSQVAAENEAKWHDYAVVNESRIREHPVFSILRKSFDALSRLDQRLFMDVALFHETHGADFHEDHMFQWLSIIHDISVDTVKKQLWGLKRKSLIELGEYGSSRVTIHDLWREYALMEITERGSEPYRWWGYTDNPGYSLFFNAFNGLSWTTSSSRPAVATFQGRLYCLYRGDDNEIWCTSSASNLYYGWTPRVNVGVNLRTIDGPALAGVGGRLVSVIRGTDSRVYWDDFDGSSWRGYEPVKGRGGYEPVQGWHGSPALAVYKNELYCCIRTGERWGKLWWVKLVGNEWLAILDMDSPRKVFGSAPSLFVFNNQLVCTVQGFSDQLYYITFNGKLWSRFEEIRSLYSPGEKGLFVFGSKLLYVKRGIYPNFERRLISRSRLEGVDSNMIEEITDTESLGQKATSLDITGGDVDSIQPQWLEDLKSLISTTMVSLGIQQTPTIIEHGANQLVQQFQGNTKGIVVGRMDTTMKEIQIILVDLETMVDVIGVGLKTEKFVLVTLGGDHVPSKVVMSVIEEIDCEKLNSSRDAFYLLHMTKDFKDQDHIAGELLQADYSSRTTYRFHIVAKLLLLMKCEEFDDESFWLKIKDLSLDWDWQDLRTAMIKCENIWNSKNHNDVQRQERGGTEHGASGSGGSRWCSNSSSRSDINKGKGKISDNQDEGDEMDIDGGNEEDDDKNGGNSFSTLTNPMEKESYSIEVRPGYNKFKIEEGKNWPYKTVSATITPLLTITFKKSASFRNCPDNVIKGREIHVKLDVNLALGGSEPDHREKQKFAWFQDYFEFSFKCMDKKAAQLKPHSGIIHKLKDQKATRGKGSTLNSAQLNIQGQGGVKAGPPIAQGTFQVTLSRSGATTTTCVQESLDTTRTQTAQGFDVVQKFDGGGKPSIGAKFTYGDIDLRSQCLKDDGTCEKGSYNLPICSSQDMSIEGTFQPHEDIEKYYKYTFQCKRDIKGWFWMKPGPTSTLIDSAPNSSSLSTPTSSASSSPCRKEQSNSILSSLLCMSLGKGINEGAVKRFKSTKESWIAKTCEQVFDLDIYITHSMNHIHGLAKQYPDGIPAIGPRDGYVNVILADKIVDENKVHES